MKVAQAIIEQSREVWLVADQHKFGRKALVRLADLAQVDMLFTDAPPPPRFAEVLREARVKVLVAA